MVRNLLTPEKRVAYFFLKSKDVQMESGVTFITLLTRLAREITTATGQEKKTRFWPLVILIVILQVVMDVWKWMRRRWDMKLAALNLTINALSVLAFFIIFWNPNIFAEDFLAWLENLFGAMNTLNWVIGGVIFAVALFSLIDAIQGFWKASLGEEEPEKSWKQVE
ncbi:hypothetical protein [Metaplanococcus flavidus]|uniref:Holin n=1 Tax=Metaplanococcus flavidus TaxID=569883 RepID=A0ABW3L7E2_9BACL